jgi:hypothetical protein
VDKLARSTLDALTGIAWADDQQVVELVVSKAYVGSTERNPGAWVTVREANLDGSRAPSSTSSKPLTEIPGSAVTGDDRALNSGTETAGGR